MIIFTTQIQEDSVIGLTEKQSLRVRTTLTELRRWLVVEDSRATKNQQKLLRNLMVGNIVVVLIKWTMLAKYIYG